MDFLPGDRLRGNRASYLEVIAHPHNASFSGTYRVAGVLVENARYFFPTQQKTRTTCFSSTKTNLLSPRTKNSPTQKCREKNKKTQICARMILAHYLPAAKKP